MPSRTFPPTPTPNSYSNTSNSIFKTRVLFLSLTISASILLFIAVLFCLFYLYYSLKNHSKTIPFDSNTPIKLQKFSYRELKSATNVFNEANSIGKGGSGTVFRGILRDGKSVAVKKLDASSLQAEREFQNELQILGGVRSPFVISLLGYCVEKKKRLLVYEYMPNRSLQESLFGESELMSILNWDQRFEIILDIARALAFLHLECDPPVIHGDIKPSNVLLSMDYRAKVSDFGLSRIKTEGEFGIDLFSQEFGRSQELSGNLAAIVPAETPTIGTPGESTSGNEVNFALALQSASTSSSPFKNNRVDYNARNLNQNVNGIGVIENTYKSSYHKGKEISTSVIDGEDWQKFVPYSDELCSIDHSKELNLSDMSTPVDDPTASPKQWGKDWWWRQDGSGELCSKDYVTEWIGSQICPSRNPDWDEESKISPVQTDFNNSNRLYKFGNGNISQLEKPRFDHLSKKKSEKKDLKGRKNSHKKQRKMQEWWKEEHLAEISKKSNTAKKLETKWKKGFKISSFSLCRKSESGESTSRRELNKSVCYSNGEFSFRKGWKKTKSRSGGSEMWSGDLFSRELSSTTSMRGTVCYVAPEYGGCGYLMEKADIYSLGVLILVIVSGRRPLHVLSSPMKLEKANLISWCRYLAQAGNILELVDERLENRYNKDQVRLCINLALLCLQKIPELRPDIGDIVKILKGEMDLPALPVEFSPSPPSKLFSRSRRRAKPDLM
ncbi:Receptor-like serine/threonine-protein kinase [Thalictrum thalictroides]|uniref:non-specific serine/threonine protein kinase n=1 Tax=Thalictrum thalictroides TaxID=46969 RepID=A0A7J6W3S7_THATH|nr:Receptor-like serine/threonine-protein kinase [Thalictrum thalictroides]